MNHSPLMRLRRLEGAALVVALAVAGCGGGNGGSAPPSTTAAPPPSQSPSPAPAPSPGPAPAPAPAPPPPAPAPAPAPNPQLQRGASLYKANCSGCHGDDPAIGTQGIYKGTSADVLAAAYRRVRDMQLFSALLSTADNTDLAAYISNRVGP
ncbi:MAG: cytochrome c [Rubrivivax sp.]|nr:cytochrome c [Rubrivivax sp.]